ncbi:MAG: CsgG/HfaB family protein [Beijerinckiaceae bacterium]
MVGPAPRLNMTPMAGALACMKHVRGRQDLRIGVSDLVDGTGVMEGLSQNSRALSQRPDMMMVVALSAAGAQLVNRSSVNVAEWELNKAMEKKLGDGRSTVVENQPVNFRPVKAGTLLGSTHYVTGAITELNWNIASGVAEGGAYSAAIGKRTYRISIAVDIVVTNTQTTEIVHARSYKKQLVGMETTANFFRFFARDSILGAIAQGNGTTKAVTDALELFNANLGEKQNEPTQTALRWVIELAAYDIMRSLRRGAGSQCDQYLPPDSLEGAPNPALVAAAPPAPPSYSAPISVRADAGSQAPSSSIASAPEPVRPVEQAAAPEPVRVAVQSAPVAPAPPPAPAAAPVKYDAVPPPPPPSSSRRASQPKPVAEKPKASSEAGAKQVAAAAKARPNSERKARKEEASEEPAAPVVVARSNPEPAEAPPPAAPASVGLRLMNGAAPPLAASFGQ